MSESLNVYLLSQIHFCWIIWIVGKTPRTKGTKGYSTYNLFIHCINTYCLFILHFTEVPILRWGELSSCQEQQISDNSNATLSFVPWITIHSVDNNPLWNCTNMPAHPMPSTALSHAYLTINANAHVYSRTHFHTNICTSTLCPETY